MPSTVVTTSCTQPNQNLSPPPQHNCFKNIIIVLFTFFPSVSTLQSIKKFNAVFNYLDEISSTASTSVTKLRKLLYPVTTINSDAFNIHSNELVGAQITQIQSTTNNVFCSPNLFSKFVKLFYKLNSKIYQFKFKFKFII